MPASHGSPSDGARDDEGAGGDLAARRGLVLESARVLFESGVSTSGVIAAAEHLAARLGTPGRLQALWGSLQLVSEDHGVAVVRSRPEAVDMRAAQAATDALSAFHAGGLSGAALRERIASAGRLPGASTLLFTTAAALGAVALVLLWGLAVPAGLALVGGAAVVGAVARRAMARHGIGPVWQVFIAALIGGLVGAAAGRFTGWSPGELVALGPALVLVPGPQLMNGGLDLAGGRITLGTARLIFATITIFAISAGVLLGLAATGRTLPVLEPAVALPPLADAGCAAVAAGAYAVFFAMPWRLLPVPVLVGGGVHLLHTVLLGAGWDLAAASGAGALVAGSVLVPVAARLRVPFAGIGSASVVSMMPSVYVHRAVSGLLDLVGRHGRGAPGLLQATVYDAATAVLVVIALVLGVVIPLRLFRPARRRTPSPRRHLGSRRRCPVAWAAAGNRGRRAFDPAGAERRSLRSRLTDDSKEERMAIGDKAKDAVQQAAGKAEEFVGKKSDDAELTAQGRKDQDMGQDRMDVERAKDAADS